MLTHTSARNRERGFTLIELLTVAIVVGVLAAVSTPIFLRHRDKATVESVRKDAEQAGLALTAQVTGSGTLPATLNPDTPNVWGYKASSPNNRLVEYAVAEDRFRLCILNTVANPDAWAVYTSATQKVASGTGTEPTGACDGNPSAPALAVEPTRGPSTPIPTPSPTAIPTVTPPDGYTCITFTSAAGATADKQNLSWSAVSNANGYRVKTYRDGVLQGATIVSGTSTVVDDPAPYNWQWTVDARGPGFTNNPCPAPTYTPDPPNAPTGVTATALLGESRATVTWSAVSGATGYSVYLDGSSSPAWNGTATSATLPNLTNGPHSVQVSTLKNGLESVKSGSASFTISSNDMFAQAVAITAPSDTLAPTESYVSPNYSNATATTQSGEAAAGVRSMWWTVEVNGGNAVVDVLAPTDGSASVASPRITIFRLNSGGYAPDLSAVPTANPPGYDPVVMTSDGAALGDPSEVLNTPLLATANYAIRVTTNDTTSAGAGKFRLRVRVAPYVDKNTYASTVISGPTAFGSVDSAVVDNTLAGRNSGEEGTGRASIWFRYQANYGGYLKATVLASDGSTAVPFSPEVSIFASSSSGTLHAKEDGTIAHSSTPMTAGSIYYIRVSVSSVAPNGRGQFKVRLDNAKFGPLA